MADRWEAVFLSEFRKDLRFGVETDRRMALRVLSLVEAVLRDPFEGVGKPEPLRFLAQTSGLGGLLRSTA